MKTFFKENFVLMAGISLPLILTLVFLAAANLRTPLKNPPITSIIYATNSYQANYNFNVTNKGELEFTYTPPNTTNGEYCCPSVPILYVYNPVTDTEEILKLPDYDRDKKTTQIIPYNKNLSNLGESPDGWRFEYDYEYSEGNVMTYMFGGGSRYGSRNVLLKDGYRVPVSKRPYENGVFIAWVLPENQK